MTEYKLEIKQIVDYPKCRIYRQFIQSLIADRSIRTNGCSGLFPVSYTHLVLDMDSPDFYERYDSLRRNRGQFRINHISWWQDELPSDEEYVEALQTLERLDWKVDYIITHCAPTAIQQKINANFKPDKLTDFLEENCNRSQFHYWLFGHYHDNRIIDEKYVLLYEQMVRVL